MISKGNSLEQKSHINYLYLKSKIIKLLPLNFDKFQLFYVKNVFKDLLYKEVYRYLKYQSI
jgi:hypothetical protein